MMFDNRENPDIVSSGDEKEDNEAWRILSIDDEPIVHEMTRLILKRERILGRDIIIETAHSAREALERIEAGERFAVGLVDIVMESEDAGFKLIEKIRKSGFHDIRLIVRTGQPGYMTESRIIDSHDIEALVLKTEMTKQKFMAVLTQALEEYRKRI